VALVLIGLWFEKRTSVFVLAALGSALTVIGFFLSPSGGALWMVLTNRGLALFAIWITAILIASRKQFEIALSLSRDNLEGEVFDRTRELREKNAVVDLLHQVAIAANGALGEEAAMQVCLDKICAYGGWPVGHVHAHSKERPGRLVPTSIWHIDDETRFANFKKVTEETEFETGEGLPGRVLQSGRAVWIRDVGEDPNFPRAKLAEDIGSHTGFGLPVLVGGEVVAVLEFFSAEVNEPDEPLLQVVDNIGTRIGRAPAARARKKLDHRHEESERFSRWRCTRFRCRRRRARSRR
jgi:hypothetical protein